MEKRITRNRGVNPMDQRIFRKALQEIKLHPDHNVQEEIDAYKQICATFNQISPIKSDVFVSPHAGFYKKLVIFKDNKQLRNANEPWPSTLSTTPASAIKLIRRTA